MDHDIATQLARLATSYESLDEQFMEHRRDVEERLRRLERWQYTVLGGSAVVSAVAAYLLRVL